MIYVYALCDASGPPPRTRGLEDAAVEILSLGAVAAACSRHADARFPATADTLWCHELVAEDLLEHRAVLPARFGTTFDSEFPLRTIGEEHSTALRAALDRVRGCVELSVRATWTPGEGSDATVSSTVRNGTEHEPAAAASSTLAAYDTPDTPAGPVSAPDGVAGQRDAGERGHAAGEPPAEEPRTDRSASGHAYLMGRVDAARRERAAQEAAQGLADAVHGPLATRAAASTCRLLPRPGTLFVGAYLVAREEVDAMRFHVKQLAAQQPRLRLVCTGPWAPSSFVPALRPSLAVGFEDHG